MSYDPHSPRDMANWFKEFVGKQAAEDLNDMAATGTFRDQGYARGGPINLTPPGEPIPVIEGGLRGSLASAIIAGNFKHLSTAPVTITIEGTKLNCDFSDAVESLRNSHGIVEGGRRFGRTTARMAALADHTIFDGLKDEMAPIPEEEANALHGKLMIDSGAVPDFQALYRQAMVNAFKSSAGAGALADIAMQANQDEVPRIDEDLARLRHALLPRPDLRTYRALDHLSAGALVQLYHGPVHAIPAKHPELACGIGVINQHGDVSDLEHYTVRGATVISGTQTYADVDGVPRSLRSRLDQLVQEFDKDTIQRALDTL